MGNDFERRRGEWWLPRFPDRRIIGTLSLLPDHRSQLDLHGQFPQILSGGYDIVLGETDSGERVSLHGAWKAAGTLSMSSSTGNSIIEATQTYVGAWFEDYAAVRLSGLNAEIDGLVDWLRGSDHLTVDYAADEKSVVLRNATLVESDCSATIGAITLEAISGGPLVGRSSARELQFLQVAAVRMRSDEHRPINVYLKLLYDFQALLWLFNPRPAQIQSISGDCEGGVRRMLSGELVKLPIGIFIRGLTKPPSGDEAFVHPICALGRSVQ